MSNSEGQKELDDEKVINDFTEHEKDMDAVTEFVGTCNSISELVDKLCIENIRLWHILDDTVSLKKELEKPDISENQRVKILEKIAKKSFENIETIKRRSIFKKAIDDGFILNVKNILEGKNANVCNENKSYGG